MTAPTRSEIVAAVEVLMAAVTEFHRAMDVPVLGKPTVPGEAEDVEPRVEIY